MGRSTGEALRDVTQCRPFPTPRCPGEARHMRLTTILLTSVCLGACAVPPPARTCEELPPTLAQAAFVTVFSPESGVSIHSPLVVRGCSRTSEGNVVWTLRARDGEILANGHANGGNFDGPAPFEISIPFAVSAPEVAELEVAGVDDSDGEGFPPPRDVRTIVLN